MIRLDLTTALPVIAAAWKDGTLKQTGTCLYSSPCALGAAMTPEERQTLVDAGQDGWDFYSLINAGDVEMPREQWGDACDLQGFFDSTSRAAFENGLNRLLKKYAA